VKALIILLAVLAAVWLWRNGRRKELAARKKPAESAPPPPAIPEDMVRCPVCGVHLPHGDALVGRQGEYCSAAHRQQAEG
jgi:uncharacterized protein